MAWTTPTTRATGDLITAAIWNADLVNNILTLGPRVTGIIPATGTTATAGTGFTYTHTDTTGVYVFTFSTAYSATPIVHAAPANSQRIAIVLNVATTGFQVDTQALSGPGTPSDGAFAFSAAPTL